MINKNRNHSHSHISLHQVNILFSVVIIVIVLTLTTTNYLHNSFQSLGGSTSLQTISYKISTGDTLWNLAAKSITTKEDVRNQIIAIQKINGLTASQQLQPGQVIQIPISQSVEDHFRFTMNNH